MTEDTPSQDFPDSYNRIYERLVKEEDDLVGLISYALYKQSKRDWIITHKKEHNRLPLPEELKIFESSNTEQNLERLRGQAEAMLVEYSSYVVDKTAPEIKEEAIKDAIIVKVDETLGKVQSQGAWWRQLIMAALGALAYSILLLLLALVLKLLGSDLLNLINKLIGAQ